VMPKAVAVAMVVPVGVRCRRGPVGVVIVSGSHHRAANPLPSIRRLRQASRRARIASITAL